MPVHPDNDGTNRDPARTVIGIPTWQPDRPILNAAVLEKIQTLPRARRSFLAFEELPPRHQGEIPSWEWSPTPLASRHIIGPWPDRSRRYDAVLLRLHRSREAVEQAAAARVIAEGQFVHRTIVELEAISLEVVDARQIKGLTSSLLIAKDVEAWQLLRAIRDYGAEAIWIGSGAGDEVVLFIDSLDDTMHVRDEAIYEITCGGRARRLRPTDTDAADSDRDGGAPNTVGLRSYMRRWIAHMTIAILAALVAHPALELAGAVVGVNITVPAVLPAVVGLAVGLAVTRPLIRRARAYRRVVAHVLELPDSQNVIVTRLDELQHGYVGDGWRLRPLEPLPSRKPHVGAPWRKRAVLHVAVAATTAVLAYPTAQLAGAMLGVSIAVPALLPSAVGLGIGVVLARPLTRRLLAHRQLLVHVRGLPNNQNVERLEELQRGDRPPPHS